MPALSIPPTRFEVSCYVETDSIPGFQDNVRGPGPRGPSKSSAPSSGETKAARLHKPCRRGHGHWPAPSSSALRYRGRVRCARARSVPHRDHPRRSAPEEAIHFRRAAQARWARVAIDLLAALRLRRRLEATSARASDDLLRRSEAVLTPGGHLEHAEGAARDESNRDALRTAARSVDRARGSLRRRDPEAALDLWQGLVSGRWSLIDHFDTDGRRLLLARENQPGGPAIAPLSLRERNVLALRAQGRSVKIIAYELGLGVSAVGACSGARAESSEFVPRLTSPRFSMRRAIGGRRSSVSDCGGSPTDIRAIVILLARDERCRQE